MVLSMLVAIIAAPGLLGSQEAIRQSQSKEKREEHRARRCNLIATCVRSSQRSREINGRPVVLRNGKLWIDTGTEDGSPLGHMYAGYYLPYPDEKYEGLVTTITDVAPIMNWIYIDRETHEVRYGVRLDAQPNLTGPFDCTRQDRRLTFGGWEGFCAVEEALGLWALYFDLDDDGLRDKIGTGKRILEVELSRKEKRFQKEAAARQEDQTTKRKVDARENAPVDEALKPEALVERPGVVGEEPIVDNKPHKAEAKEDEKPKPFRIPKSIFENPPPSLQGSIFERPSTPPPAYEPTESLKDPIDPTPPPPPPPGHDDVVNMTPSKGKDQFMPNMPKEMLKPATPMVKKNFQERKVAHTSPEPGTVRNRSTSPGDPLVSTLDEDRSTQRLNRSSGTRALAQAQMFEAMAAAQKPARTAQQISAKRVSRASSASEYSRSSTDISKELLSVKRASRSVSPTPAPLVFAVSKKQEPAPRTSTERPNTNPRQRALTAPSDPAVFATEARKTVRTREPLRRPSQTAIKSSNGSSTLRSTSQGSPRPPFQRQRIATVQAAASGSSITLSQTNRGTRGSLASTMTTGKGNRGMTTRASEPRGKGLPTRSATIQSIGRTVTGRKTTSALFREIDELVSQDVGREGSNG